MLRQCWQKRGYAIDRPTRADGSCLAAGIPVGAGCVIYRFTKWLCKDIYLTRLTCSARRCGKAPRSGSFLRLKIFATIGKSRQPRHSFFVGRMIFRPKYIGSRMASELIQCPVLFCLEYFASSYPGKTKPPLLNSLVSLNGAHAFE